MSSHCFWITLVNVLTFKVMVFSYAGWNAKLSEDDFRQEYIDYHCKTVIPNSYYQRGDNAVYYLADCFFSRKFWTKFTWTGVSKGATPKSRRGFREFGNVLQLFFEITVVGDPTYSKEKLQNFIQNRLFRYSKTRADSKFLRKSTIRPKRATSNKRDALTTDQIDEEMEMEEAEEVDEQVDEVDEQMSEYLEDESRNSE
ncbi:uncharacterized protein LOC129748125 [Uranotaenia lowii]|uniref:uncharacterized protein LOC129748125 n=1 Tax=Uranotaenia lowii TaxID=190385 RepID=UPI00247949BE|nr:uncharacterized protein LOC129748125 [Uranotaenia lowii]